MPCQWDTGGVPLLLLLLLFLLLLLGVQIKNAVCMHEEDVGLLWKHVEYR
jgi:hypothetical protein